MPYNNELYHHGVKGMHWGVRRYQNKDGSLTALGRHRFGNTETYSKYRAYKQASKDAKKANTWSYDEKSRAKEDRARVEYLKSKEKAGKFTISDSTKHKLMIGGAAAAIAGVTVASIAVSKHRMAASLVDGVIKSGTKIQRVAAEGEKFTTFDRFYAAATKMDKAAYPGIIRKGDKIVKVNVNSDIKIAGRKTGAEIYNDLIKKNKVFAEAMANSNITNYVEYNIHLGVVNGTMRTSAGHIEKSKVDNIFFKALNDRGYGGVKDMNDIHNGLNAANPVIFTKNPQAFTIESIKDKNAHTQGKALAVNVIRQFQNHPLDNEVTYIGGVVGMGGVVGLLADSSQPKSRVYTRKTPYRKS